MQSIFDLPSLISWISARQYAPEGGFSGRTNKLVDGCYSHWVGGCWPLIEAAVGQPTGKSLYSREGIIRYIVCCCQSEGGGLRDKPGRCVFSTSVPLTPRTTDDLFKKKEKR